MHNHWRCIIFSRGLTTVCSTRWRETTMKKSNFFSNLSALTFGKAAVNILLGENENKTGQWGTIGGSCCKLLDERTLKRYDTNATDERETTRRKCLVVARLALVRPTRHFHQTLKSRARPRPVSLRRDG